MMDEVRCEWWRVRTRCELWSVRARDESGM